MSSDLTLWGIGTPRAMRAHWMLAEMELDYECHPVRARSGETMTEEFLALNPKHKIPVLRHGDFVLTESAAIVAYLGETFPPPPGFFVPREPAARARVNEYLFFCMSELDAQALYVIRKHLELAEIYGASPVVVEAARAYFTDQASALLAKRGTDWETLMDEGMSVADILLTTCVTSALGRAIEVPEPLIAYKDRIVQRPAYIRAFRRTFPDRPIPDGS